MMVMAGSVAVWCLPVQAQVYNDGYESADILPEVVAEAAREAKSGIVLQKAKLTWRTDEGVYVVVGRVYGKIWRMNITSSGDVLSVVELDEK